MTEKTLTTAYWTPSKDLCDSLPPIKWKGVFYMGEMYSWDEWISSSRPGNNPVEDEEDQQDDD